MPQLKIRDGDKIKLYEILEDSLYIGSSQECQLRLRDPEIGGLHCQIKRVRDGWKLIDLESKSGTRVNGEFVNQHPLENGDKIRVGPTLMRFEQKEPAVVFEGSSTRRRLEREQGALDRVPVWGVVSIVAGGVLLIVVFLLVVFGGSGPTRAQKQAQLARDLLNRGDVEGARALIEEVQDWHDLDPVMKREFEELAARIERDEKSEEALDNTMELQRRLQQIIAYADEHKRDLELKEDVLGRFDRWATQYPDAPQFLKDHWKRNRELAVSNFEKLEASKKRRDNW